MIVMSSSVSGGFSCGKTRNEQSYSVLASLRRASTSTYLSGIGRRCCPRRSVFNKCIIGIAIQPLFSELGGGDYRVAGCMRVLGGMAVGRTVAAERDAALLAGTQMHPTAARFCTLLAFMALGLLDLHDRVDVFAVCVGHGVIRGNGAPILAKGADFASRAMLAA